MSCMFTLHFILLSYILHQVKIDCSTIYFSFIRKLMYILLASFSWILFQASNWHIAQSQYSTSLSCNCALNSTDTQNLYYTLHSDIYPLLLINHSSHWSYIHMVPAEVYKTFIKTSDKGNKSHFALSRVISTKRLVMGPTHPHLIMYAVIGKKTNKIQHFFTFYNFGINSSKIHPQFINMKVHPAMWRVT